MKNAGVWRRGDSELGCVQGRTRGTCNCNEACRHRGEYFKFPHTLWRFLPFSPFTPSLFSQHSHSPCITKDYWVADLASRIWCVMSARRLGAMATPPRTRQQAKKVRVLACEACRTRRTRCDGRKPTCRACEARSCYCNYPEVRQDKTRTSGSGTSPLITKFPGK